MAARLRTGNVRRMADSHDQPVVDSAENVAPPPGEHHRPWGWITVCALLALVVGGLGIWAFSLRSDLDEQTDETAQVQQQADQANQEVESLSNEVDQISQTVSDAGDELSQAGDDAQQNVEQSLAGLETKLDSLKGQIEKAIDDPGTANAASGP
jgi:septal ring factor EnvC (AmiA/AmiB activator)